MLKPSKNKYATEEFVYKVTNDLEKRINERFDEAEVKAEERYSKVIDHLDSLAGQFKKFDEEREMMADKIATHSDQIEEFQKIAFA